MKKVLGLDLGVASIGWAIISENDQTQELIRSGVRIIPIDSDTVTNFSKGIPTSKNADRRLKRSARRNNHRYKLRKHFLIEFLKKNSLWPIPESLFKLNATELYGLRNKALDNEIEFPELARIWFHLNQKRGYIESRKGISEEENTKYVEAIKNRSSKLYETYKTVGSYFYHKLLENPLYRIKSGNDKENIFLVDDYKKEFDQIWNKQKEFYPSILTDENYNEVRNRIIYYKRKLKSQRHLIGECRFEKHHKSMPSSSPIAEEVRLWQDINNLRITNKYNEVFELTPEQKTDLYGYLADNEKISEKDILKRYGYPYSSKEGYKINFEKAIRGYVFRAKLLQLFNQYGVSPDNFLGFDPISEKFTEHHYYNLWHLIYSIDDIAELQKALESKYGFNAELIGKLLKLPLKNDFAALSSRAGRKILPYLRQGLIYSEACKAAGYKHSDSLTKEENEVRPLIRINDLELIEPNTLRNPTVEKILNQLINLLKSLHADGHSFDEIRIELARELKKNAKERKRINENNRENEALNAQCKNDIARHGITNVSKKDIEKYKLWMEFDGCSPYEPTKRIELAELFNKALYEIEHIIPKSRYFDDSFNNKTIARVNVNKEKDNQTAYDYMAGKSAELLYQYTEGIKHNQKISKTKRKYLLLEGKDIPDDFVNRQLNETRYITSETLKLLKSVCRNVYSTSGSVTDYLRHNWGYDNILQDLNLTRVSPEDIIIREVDNKKQQAIKDWSKRLDNRHHALDAIVIACTKQGYIQQLNRLNQFYNNEELKAQPIRNKVPFNYDVVKANIENILISYKPGQKVATLKTVKKDRWQKKPGNLGQKTLVPRGPLHQESVYGSVYKQRKIDIRKLADVSACAVPEQKQAIISHLTKYEGDLNKGLKNLKKDPIIYKGTQTLTEVTIFKRMFVKKYDLEYSATNKFDLKTAKSIVNDNVKRIVIARLNQFEGDPSKAFKNLNDNPLYFNDEKRIAVKSVRCYITDENYEGHYPALHEAANGSTLNHKQGTSISNGKEPVDYVIEGNNHHISIFEDENKDRHEIACTFFEAFQRKAQGENPIIKTHPNGYKFLFSIQRNEMFVFKLEEEKFLSAVANKDYPLISKYLFRAQDLAPGQYIFIHHLEGKRPNKTEEKQKAKKENKLIQCSAKSVSHLKVKVTRTGDIELFK